jgi:serine/threonine-protein kinase
MILGTAAYMSPEQASGSPVDKRADIWSFGVVLSEMLSGKRLFGGDTIAHTLADVLRGPINFERLAAPEPVKHLLRRCLDRDVKTRLRDIGEARVAIAAHLADPAAGGEIAPRTKPRPAWPAWAAAAILAVIAVAGWLRARPEQTSPAPGLVLTFAPKSGSLAQVGEFDATPQISPDGSAVVFTGPSGYQLRRLDSLDPEPLRATGVLNPGFWANDSKTYVYCDADSVRKIRVPDGASELIAKGVVGPVLGGGVSAGGAIVFTAVKALPHLYVVPSSTSEVKPLEITGLPEGNSFWPEFLPDSEEILFLHQSSSDERGVYLAALRDGKGADPVLLMRNDTAAHYTSAGGGRILFVRDDNLYAQRLNRTSRKLDGDPELIQRAVSSSPAFFTAHFSVSRAGILAWRPGRAGLSQVAVLNRQGKEIAAAGAPSVIQTLRLAPDETRLLLAYFRRAWLLEPGKPGQQQLEQGSWNMLWSPDGTRFVELIPGDKGLHMVERPVTGGPSRDLPTPPGIGRPLDISGDGKTLLFNRGAVDTALFSFRLDGSEKDARSLVQTGEAIAHAAFSPDGLSIVYTAYAFSRGATGGIYVQPFPGPGLRRTQIASGGNYPIWRKDGREIVYIDPYQGRDYIWSVSVTPGADVHNGTPTPLFPIRMPASTFGDLNFLGVSRDGSRFYIPQAVEQPGSDVINIRTGSIK